MFVVCVFLSKPNRNQKQTAMSLTIEKPPIDSQQVAGNFTKVVTTTLGRVPDLMEVGREGRNYQQAKKRGSLNELNFHAFRVIKLMVDFYKTGKQTTRTAKKQLGDKQHH